MSESKVPADAERRFLVNMPLRVLFVPFGSEGDVNPLLWLADGMAAQGHLPTFMITPHYGHLVERRGFPWLPIGTEREFVRFARDPHLWHKTRGPKTVIRGMLETLPAYREAFSRANSQFDLVVLSSLALGAASVSEAVGIPRLTLHMQPALFRSTYDCPVFLEELSWLARSPRWAKRVFFKIVDRLLWETPRKTVNRFRSGLNLAPIRDFYLEGFHGAEGCRRPLPVLVRSSAIRLAAEGPAIRFSSRQLRSKAVIRASRGLSRDRRQAGALDPRIGQFRYSPFPKAGAGNLAGTQFAMLAGQP